MDIDMARTFLAVAETGSFVDAADRVYVTQSTVSMRIKMLEQQLGKILFKRSKAGSQLTTAGVQFHRHAVAMLRIWEQARLEVALPSGYRAALTVGGHYSLWDGFLFDWLARMRTKSPDIAIRTQAGFSEALMHQLADGTLDLGIMYAPQSRPGFDVEILFDEELVLVSTLSPNSGVGDCSYIYIDWGPEFREDHALNFPGISTPGVFMELGSLSLQYLLGNKASGYFPRRLIEPHLRDNELRLVKKAPVFRYPAYAVYASEGDGGALDEALATLRSVASLQSKIHQ